MMQPHWDHSVWYAKVDSSIHAGSSRAHYPLYQSAAICRSRRLRQETPRAEAPGAHQKPDPGR